MSIYLGCDGKYKLGRLHVAFDLRDDDFNREEFMRFFESLIYWFKEEELPPELSLGSKEKIVSVYSDIWRLGVVMSELTGIATKPKIYYSDELMNLQEMMLNTDPNKRPSAKEVLKYITKKESIIGLSNTTILNPVVNKKPSNNLKEGFSELINRSGTK